MTMFAKIPCKYEGLTEIGAGCKIYPFASLEQTTGLKYKGEKSQLIIK